MRNLILLNFLFLAVTASAKTQTNSSIYTSIESKNCLTITNSLEDPQAEIDSFSEECPGLYGYRVFPQGSDGRGYINLSFEGVEIDFNQVGSRGYFTGIAGKNLEWRVRKVGSKKTPYALIYRISSKDAETGKKNINELVVISLKGKDSCVVGYAKDNQTARTLADNSSLTCPAK